MAWRRIGDKPLPEPMMIQFTDAYIDGLVQERRNSIANTLGLRLSCTIQSIYALPGHNSYADQSYHSVSDRLDHVQCVTVIIARELAESQVIENFDCLQA